MKKIAIFNHKGGVGKTTSSFHLGWKFSELGHRVLLVDADSQCNLSQICFSEFIRSKFNLDTPFEKFVKQNPLINIKDAVECAFSGSPKTIKALNVPSVKANPELFIIPGSFDITEYEVQLGVSFNLTQTFSALINLPGAFNAMIQKTAESVGADVVIIDMNPSLSSINQALLMSSDFFIIPLAPDYFSRMALKSLKKMILKWERWAKTARSFTASSAYPIPSNQPKFIGAIIQRFNIRNGAPTAATKTMIASLNKDLYEFASDLRAYRLLADNNEMDIDHFITKYCLAQISDFQSLAPCYHAFGKPIYKLETLDLQEYSKSRETSRGTVIGGTVLKNYEDMIQRFDNEYTDLCNKITAYF